MITIFIPKEDVPEIKKRIENFKIMEKDVRELIEIEFKIDVPCDTRVWLEKSKTKIPVCKGNRDRKPTKEKPVEGKPNLIEVQEIEKQLTSSQWDNIFL